MERRKDNIRRMFDGIAPEYDRLNHLLSMGFDRSWRRRALKEVLPAPGPAPASGGPTPDPASYRVLDIACGTGDFSLEIARRLPQGGSVTGVDISEGMLAVMLEKVALQGLQGKISAIPGDCEALPFPDASFDCATIGFGIRNFEHREAALREILRVLKPQGKLVILELSVPETPVIRQLFLFYFTKIAPLVGGLISGDRNAYSYLPASVKAFPGKEKWMATMRGCGFREVTHKAFTFGTCRLYRGVKP